MWRLKICFSPSGYAIEVLTEKAAKESLEAWDELLKILDEEELS